MSVCCLVSKSACALFEVTGAGSSTRMTAHDCQFLLHRTHGRWRSSLNCMHNRRRSSKAPSLHIGTGMTRQPRLSKVVVISWFVVGDTIIVNLEQKSLGVLFCRPWKFSTISAAGPSKQALAWTFPRGKSSFLQERRMQISDD